MYIFNGGKVFRLRLLRLWRGRAWGVRQSGHLSQDPVVVLKHRIHPQRVLKGVGGEGVPTWREGAGRERAGSQHITNHEEGGGRGETTRTKQSWQHWHLHQGDGLPVAGALLVDENQDADDGAHKTQAPHQTGDDERRVHRHGYQLAAALAVVVPVFTHRASGEDVQRWTSSPEETREPLHRFYFIFMKLEVFMETFDLNINYRMGGGDLEFCNNLISCKVMRRHLQHRVSYLEKYGTRPKLQTALESHQRVQRQETSEVKCRTLGESTRSDCYCAVHINNESKGETDLWVPR